MQVSAVARMISEPGPGSGLQRSSERQGIVAVPLTSKWGALTDHPLQFGLGQKLRGSNAERIGNPHDRDECDVVFAALDPTEV